MGGKYGLSPPPLLFFVDGTLQVAGFELQRRYGAAMDKVVKTVKEEVLPALLPKSMVRNQELIGRLLKPTYIRCFDRSPA